MSLTNYQVQFATHIDQSLIFNLQIIAKHIRENII